MSGSIAPVDVARSRYAWALAGFSQAESATALASVRVIAARQELATAIARQPLITETSCDVYL